MKTIKTTEKFDAQGNITERIAITAESPAPPFWAPEPVAYIPGLYQPEPAVDKKRHITFTGNVQ